MLKKFAPKMFVGFFVIFLLFAPLFVDKLNLVTILYNAFFAAFICTGMIVVFYGSMVGVAKLGGGDW